LAYKELGLDRVERGDLDEMIARRVIRALVTYSETFYFLDGPNQRGVSYEAFKMFEDELNKELGTGNLKVHVVLLPIPRDRLLPALTEGLGDIAAAGLTITPERQKLVDFSDPMLTGVKEIVVTGPTAPALESLDDLAGQQIYVRQSSSYYQSLQELNRTFEQAGRPQMILKPAEEYLEDEDLLEMVDTGLIPMIVVDEHKAEFWDQIFENITLHPTLAVRDRGAIAWAFRKNSPQLAEAVNRFVARHKKGTLMGNILLKRYLKDTKYVKNALAGEDRERFDQTVGLFKKHAAQYGFDYLMMVAQGFQESRLDQSLVSPRGAVGIMQLLPSTAADKSVAIPDIHNADNNIHAGVKYMRWIRETYFNDDAVDEKNKTLFSFASYNAGPNRIRRLRAKAAERGLDPNEWFQNVEIIAAEEIGRETVQYVSNIYKYYAAYRLVMDELARKGRRT
jgi:membrane-bound lytic murein transglycosylase MltF